MAHFEIPKQMRAVQVVQFNKPYEIRNVPVPQELGPHDLLVKIAVAANCHTDSIMQSGAFKPPLPCTASHEGAGTVVRVGPQVDKARIGQRVMCGIPVHPCGACPDCTSGPENQRQYCANVERHAGVLGDGYLADYAIADARNTTPLPDQITFESAAPLACAGRTIWRGVDQAGLKSGEWIALIGSGGGLGHLGIQFARAHGLNIVGVDARDDGLELSKEYGSTIVVDARKGKDEVVKQIQAVTSGQGVDAAIVLSDHKDATAIACAATKMHGTVIQIAQPEQVSIPFHELIFRDIRLKASLLCSELESQQMLRDVVEHKIVCKTNPFYGMDKIHELVELVHGGKIQGKAIMIIDEEQIKKEKELDATL